MGTKGQVSIVVSGRSPVDRLMPSDRRIARSFHGLGFCRRPTWRKWRIADDRNRLLIGHQSSSRHCRIEGMRRLTVSAPRRHGVSALTGRLKAGTCADRAPKTVKLEMASNTANATVPSSIPTILALSVELGGPSATRPTIRLCNRPVPSAGIDRFAERGDPMIRVSRRVRRFGSAGSWASGCKQVSDSPARASPGRDERARSHTGPEFSHDGPSSEAAVSHFRRAGSPDARPIVGDDPTKQPHWFAGGCRRPQGRSKRRRWDSNPRNRRPVHRFSRPALSTTQAPLRGCFKATGDDPRKTSKARHRSLRQGGRPSGGPDDSGEDRQAAGRDSGRPRLSGRRPRRRVGRSDWPQAPPRTSGRAPAWRKACNRRASIVRATGPPETGPDIRRGRSGRGGFRGGCMPAR